MRLGSAWVTTMLDNQGLSYKMVETVSYFLHFDFFSIGKDGAKTQKKKGTKVKKKSEDEDEEKHRK